MAMSGDSYSAVQVIMSEGDVWIEQRRFTLRTLRDFGFGKVGMEEMINEEVAHFNEEIRKAEGEPFDFINKFNLPILNALWRMLVGERFEYDDPRLISIIKRMTEWLKRSANPGQILVLCYPWLVKLFPKFMERDVTLEVIHEVINMMKSSIKEHEETLDPNEPRDFIDKVIPREPLAYIDDFFKVLIEISRTTDPTSSYYKDTGLENLANTLFDLFLAGSETTSTTLTWAVLYMARYPEVQRKVQDELDRTVGREQGDLSEGQSEPPLHRGRGDGSAEMCQHHS